MDSKAELTHFARGEEGIPGCVRRITGSARCFVLPNVNWERLRQRPPQRRPKRDNGKHVVVFYQGGEGKKGRRISQQRK